MVSVPGRPLRRLACACLLSASLCVALVDVAAAPAAAPACASARGASDATPRAVARVTVCLMNSVRAEHGLGRLRVHRGLARAARRHARDMSRHGYLAHRSRDGSDISDRVRRTGYLDDAMRWTVGENIARGIGAASSPRATMRAWMRSPAHRANVLGASYREVGLGVAPDKPGGGHPRSAIYVAVFGDRD